ncbi:hypothetical protein FLCU109888_09050 [Flavobacterium cucumis]|uniref:Uncharacterized protein n=1 Tax=Flavobacterium cucumis TaxID=416016 RepID=A0A1M7ZX32_9FLAO|nr:hypothetical protein SAMN05443547_1787 [Flavobacterium cucumis]
MAKVIKSKIFKRKKEENHNFNLYQAYNLNPVKLMHF